MHELIRRRVADRDLVVSASQRGDGDVHPIRVGAAELLARQRCLTGEPWTMTDQVHGTTVAHVDDAEPWLPVTATADVVVVSAPTRPVAVWAADCAALVLCDRSATMLVGVHAGWRGIAAGVIDVGLDVFASVGAHVGCAVLGPCIRHCCYEFGADDLAVVADAVGSAPGQLSAPTADGSNGLDVVAAVAAALGRRGVALDSSGPCTGCDPQWFSHRRRHDLGRHAVVAWFEDAS